MYSVVFVGSKWCDSYPPHGISNSEHNVIGSLEETGIAKCDWFSFDEFHLLHKQPGDVALIKLCEDNKYDLIILDWAHAGYEPVEMSMDYFTQIEEKKFVPGTYDWLNPTDKTLDILSHKLNIPIVCIEWDSVWSNQLNQAERLLDYIKFHIVVDTSFLLRIVKDPSRYLCLWTPQDPRIFYSIDEKERDIPFSFLGRLYKGDMSQRRDAIHFLRKHGVDVFHVGGQRERTAVSVDKYASCIRRSKISLSFPRSPTEISQLTGRTLEVTLSGSMLLEDLNSETLRYFVPMIDYVPFHSNTDMLVKALYYMENENERIAIANRGHKKATEYYDNKNFWNIVFAEVFHEYAEEHIICR